MLQNINKRYNLTIPNNSFCNFHSKQVIAVVPIHQSHFTNVYPVFFQYSLFSMKSSLCHNKKTTPYRPTNLIWQQYLHLTYHRLITRHSSDKLSPCIWRTRILLTRRKKHSTTDATSSIFQFKWKAAYSVLASIWIYNFQAVICYYSVILTHIFVENSIFTSLFVASGRSENIYVDIWAVFYKVPYVTEYWKFQ